MNGISANSVGSETACRQSHIDRELSILEGSTNRLEAALNRLVDRLQPVLHHSGLNDPQKQSPDEVIAPLANRVRETRKRIECFEAALDVLISSIEI